MLRIRDPQTVISHDFSPFRMKVLANGATYHVLRGATPRKTEVRNGRQDYGESSNQAI